ncbi:MAG: hypothetical protein EA379_09180 [Phycisphaerales bacterium]|nr:MAG: hypothetical protein EA379_09180 [Phycisphaerales bacterium]
MRTPRFVSRRSIAALVAVALSTPMVALGSTQAETLDHAAALLRDGHLVRAKHVLLSLDQSTLTRADSERVMSILTTVDRRLRHADPIEVSLDKAEIALEEGDLRTAERHAQAAANHRGVSRAQRKRAEGLLGETLTLREELQPLAVAVLEQAVMDFDSGRYAEAKAGFDSVYRTGCTLDADELRILDHYRVRIVDLERQRGEPYAIDYTPLGMLQPGRVRRVDDPRPSGRADEAEDVAAFEYEEEAGEAQDEERPETVQPEPEPEPAAAEGDLFQQALGFDAQRYLAEADAAFTAGRFNEAEQKYALVTGPYRAHVDADRLAHAESRLAETRVLLGQRDGRLLEQVGRSQEIVRQQADAEYENFMNQARRALSEGDFERARSLAGRARIAVSERRDVFTEREHRDRIQRQEALMTSIRTAEESTRVREIERRTQDVQRQTRDAESRAAAERDRKIVESLDRIRALQLEQKYEEALQVIDQVLFLDPNNPAGLLLRDVMRDVVQYREFDRIQRDRAFSYTVESNRMQEGLIIPQDIMSYPRDWPEISNRRGEPIAFTDSDEDRRVLADLENRRIPATFSANALEDVLNFIATVTNLNVDVNWESLQNIGVDRDTEVSLNLRSMPVRVVLQRILEKVSPDDFSRAGWAVEDGVLVIASEEALRKNTFIRIYDVRDLTFQIPNFTNVPDLDLDSVLQQGGQRGGGGGGGGIFQDPGDDDVDIDESEMLERIQEIIRTNVDFEGWRENGGNTGYIQELNGNLIITNTARNHREIVGLLSQLREVRAIQISVESRFLTVSQDFFEQIGIDLDIYFNAQNNQYRGVRQQELFFGGAGSPSNPLSSGPVTTPRDVVGALTTNRITNTPQYFFEEVDGDGNVVYQFNPLPTAVPAPDRTSIIPVQSGSLGMAKDLISGGFATSVLASNPALGIAGTFLDDIQVDLLIEATQADRRNVSLTAPRLTFVNGRAANIFVATQQSFVSDLTPVVGSSSVAFDPTVSPLTTGVTLLLRGVVSADRRYVTMTIQSRVANFTGFRNVPVSAAVGAGGGAGGAVGGGAVATSNIEAPEIAISAISTGVTVPDQGTILLGGQRMVSESEVETGVPVLSKLPILNRFFTNRIETKEEQTLLMLLKPTIIIQNEEEEKHFPGLLDSLGRGFGNTF